MNSTKSQKIEEFLDELSSASPTPGGGAVAALAGAMAAGLVEMVCNLTIGKKKYERVYGEIIEIRLKAQKDKKSLLKLADEDIEAFNNVMSAYKKRDKTQVRKALTGATIIPLTIAKICSELVGAAKRVARIGNKNAISDAKVALHLARAAKLSALENVKINLKYIEDEKFIKKVKRISDSL